MTVSHRPGFSRALAVVLLLVLAAARGLPAVLEDGLKAYQEGRFEEAYEVFSVLFRQDPLNPDFSFGLGLSAMAGRRHAHAAFAFERVLAVNPGNHRARLELARAYFAMGRLDLAQEQFEQVRREDVPEPVQKNIDLYLTKIRDMRKRWDVELILGFTGLYDDNVNFGPLSRSVDTLVGELVVVDDARPQDAWGAAVSGSGAFKYDFGRRGFWLATARADAYRNWMADEPGQEILFARGQAGLRRAGRRTLLELPVRADTLDYGHEPLLRMVGADPAFLWAASARWQMISRLNAEVRDYRDNDDRDADFFRAGEQVRYLTGGGHSVSLEAYGFAEEADEDPFTNQGWETALSAEVGLPWDARFYAMAKYREIDYDAVLYADLQSDPRDDRQWQFLAGVRQPLPWNLEIDLSYRYVNNDSNFGLYDYERNVATLTTFVKF